MAKGLFDHINAITKEQDPNYWEKLDDADKKTWSNWLIIRYMSMNPEWIELVAEIQPYIQEAPPRAVYKALIGVIPKGKTYLRYMKGKSVKDYDDWLIELVAKWYEVSTKHASEYLDILYENTSGREEIKKIAEAYGTDTKLITKLKLKV
jgi:hypothetical protein